MKRLFFGRLGLIKNTSGSLTSRWVSQITPQSRPWTSGIEPGSLTEQRESERETETERQTETETERDRERERFKQREEK